MLRTTQNAWRKKLKKIKQDTPYLVVDNDVVSRSVTAFNKALPECEIYYAIKAFSDEQFLINLDKRVSGFDVASLGELEKLLRIGINADRIMFSNPVKKPEHIRKAYDYGVRYFAFDALSELKKIADNAPGSHVYLRLIVSDHGSAFPLSAKFGANPSYAVPFMDTAVDFGLKPSGITFHVGSQSENLHVWEVALETCGGIMRRLQDVGIELEFVNIGGGFPAEYTERVTNIAEIGKTINRGIKKHLPYEPRIIAEPGRYMIAEAGVMVASVIGRETRGGANWLYLDVGAFNGFMEPLEMNEWKYPVFTESKDTLSNPQHFTLTGPTCDAYDTFGFAVPLPASVGIGDKVYIGSAGAYTVVYASEFNGFDVPQCTYIGSKL